MSGQLIMISDKDEDLRFGEFLAFANNLPFVQVTQLNDIRTVVGEDPQAIVFWSADHQETVSSIGEVLSTAATPNRVFAITDTPLSDNPHLFKQTAFGHHMIRRYEEPASVIFSKILGATLSPHPFNLLRYFPSGTSSHRIKLTRSGQKNSAVEAIQTYLKNQSIVSRLAALVAQASDELIMNALFDAPVLPDGTPLRRSTDRRADFELIEREFIDIDIANSKEYVGVSVSDRFGSLKKSIVMKFLGRDYQNSEYVPAPNDPSAGLGLHGIIHTGLSIVFVSKPGVKTEVMIFFPRTENYRDFRKGFRFVSILSS